MREPGIYANVDIEEYHSEEGISSSGISLILDCPKRYWWEYLVFGRGPEDAINAKKAKDKFILGSAFHAAILEPNKFNERYYLMDKPVNLTTKIGKAAYEYAEILAEGRQIIRFNDAQDLRAMEMSVREHSLWKNINLAEGNVEHSLYWDAGIYKTRLRARPDFYNDNIIIDLKTTDSIAGFAKSLYNYGYHRQAAMQIDGLLELDGKKRHFAFFVVEKKAPYLTACYTLDEESIEQGRKEYLDGAATYSECLRFNLWPGYEDKFQLITLPKYMKKTEEIENETI